MIPKEIRDQIERAAVHYAGKTNTHAERDEAFEDGAQFGYNLPRWVTDPNEFPPHDTPVMAEVEGYSKLMVMAYCMVGGGEESYGAWCNCYGDMDGDPQNDDVYNVLRWQPFPEV